MLTRGTNGRILGKGNVVWGSLIAGVGIVLLEWVEIEGGGGLYK